MELELSWQQVIARLGLAVAAGLVVGFNREERSQAAGLRTTVLVCMAACLAMVLANLLLNTTGKDQSKFAQIDVLRLPLGVLSGIGFIGAGAILRKGDVVSGVTTAATIWFMTVVGLCIGAGQLALGAAATVLVVALLWGLRWVDLKMTRKFRAALVVRAARGGLPEEALRQTIEGAGHRIVAWAVTYEDSAQRYEVHGELEWRGRESDRAEAPSFVRDLAQDPAILCARWEPAATPG